jgi:hypothetical protein
VSILPSHWLEPVSKCVRSVPLFLRP